LTTGFPDGGAGQHAGVDGDTEDKDINTPTSAAKKHLRAIMASSTSEFDPRLSARI